MNEVGCLLFITYYVFLNLRMNTTRLPRNNERVRKLGEEVIRGVPGSPVVIVVSVGIERIQCRTEFRLKHV